MKKMKKITLALLAVTFTCIVSGQVVPPPIPPPPPPGLPIDGGVLLLAITGLFYGAKKLKK